MMNIGEAAHASGMSARMIRHYESLGLLPAAGRTQSGYRQYTEVDVHSLRFIRHARDLGFGTAQIEQLLALWHNRRRTNRTVRGLALAHLSQLDAKIEALQAMRATLQHLVDACQGDERPDCPILQGLAESNLSSPQAASRASRA